MDKKTEKKEFLVCPKCGSTMLEWLHGGNLGDQYHCRNCNYQGVALKGNAKFIKKLQQNKKGGKDA